MEDPGKIGLRHWANFEKQTTELIQVRMERDSAIAERDKALADKKVACNERDAALLQRDVAYADRNTAWAERDKAITALTIICNNGNDPEGTAKLLQVVNFVAHRARMGSNSLCFPSTVVEEENDFEEGRLSQRHGKQLAKAGKKETSKKRKAGMVLGQEKKGSKSSKKKQKNQETQGKAGKSKPNDVSKSLVTDVPPYDLTSTPVPLCSCTGTDRQCYRWGSGGWQSSCCTTFLSVYPLPLNNTKRSSRVAGRKMSGGAFKKLLERLARAGEDVTQPIDLKNHWAKHGTNKYVIVK